MDKKDSKKFEELYWKEDAYARRTFEEIEKLIQCYRDAYINDLSEERKKIFFEDKYESSFQLNAYNKDYAEKLLRDVNLSPNSYSTRSWILTNGMYLTYKNNDVGILKNALHTLNRLTYGEMLSTSGGYNHSGSFVEVIYAFADGDVELVKRYLPVIHGLADNKTYLFFRPGCNLIMGMIYENSKWIEEAQNQALKFCERKSSAKNDILVVEYLLALNRKEIDKASSLLQEITDNYRKMNWLFNFKNGFLKFFGVYIHGLYYFARFVLPDELFRQMNVPEHSVFWQDFDLYTKKMNFSTGKSIFKWEGNCTGLNRLFEF